ncbi:type II secretion system F family protein [Aromatoleum bremense]|uniref:Type II secretion system F family protein n=1 Tax=Aromatoleum bremense TaxID=76115 RepID=A0ABX1NWX6_9RHOO|nr:type II secretion system F family protein [Aromatoleum bremense]NMG16177.1 type II secretion system F family protein [Aromatoleum bremense]QTQ32616.1 Putative type II secretion system protein F [Aromatoleum bremense]
MTEFAYRAAHGDGNMVDGRIEAASRENALRQLRSQGLTPIRLEVAAAVRTIAPKPATPLPSSPQRMSGPAKITGKQGEPVVHASRGLFATDRKPGHVDVFHLTGELAVMLRAGLPLDRALKVMVSMSQRPAITALLDDLLDSVKSGKGFSQALQPHQRLFGEFYINMVRSGEAGGQLGEVLSRLAEHLERTRALRESVVSALIYPAILVLVAAVSVFLMLAFVVPQFESLFNDMGDALPLPTRIIVGAGHLVADWGWLAALVVALGVVVFRRWLHTPAGRNWRDACVLSLPVLGSVVQKFEITRFARSMGTLLGNGVPIVTAIKIASDTMDNVRLREAMLGVAPAIKQGGRMAEALGGTGLFTPLALNMVRLGEETGRLDEMLLELARVHDGEVQSGIKRALTMLEPLLILGLGGVIAAIIVSILMGILSVNDLAV